MYIKMVTSFAQLKEKKIPLNTFRPITLTHLSRCKQKPYTHKLCTIAAIPRRQGSLVLLIEKFHSTPYVSIRKEKEAKKDKRLKTNPGFKGNKKNNLRTTMDRS